MAGLITAILGATNTGKTYQAVQRMMQYHDGVIGFPLRLLARENYDRIVEIKGKNTVALVTGEEKIIPRHARYFVCTVESMPLNRSFDFVAVDEIQLCSDPDRGHIFTDRLLYARGKKETIFMGAQTIAPLLKSCIPDIIIETHERFSQLTYTGHQKLSRLPPRSAIVAFSVADVYAIADMMRHQRGGAAIVMGALSPRTRNAQVALFQNGEVDYLIATDAIGMGLNMDVDHIALAALVKFDGAHRRRVTAAELGQIAGRAGRYQRNGTFGTTADIGELDAEIIGAIETHSYKPIEKLIWRHAVDDVRSPKLLLKSLEKPCPDGRFAKGRPALDYLTLQAFLKEFPKIDQIQQRDHVRLLWEVCQIPDFRKTLSESHFRFVFDIFNFLWQSDTIALDWMAERILRLHNVEGSIETLMTRLAYIRTWAYIVHHNEWIQNPHEWQEKTRQIEDDLSDSLHQKLTLKYVDQRAFILNRSLKNPENAVCWVKNDGKVVLEGQDIGHLHAFRFIPIETGYAADSKLFIKAARQGLRQEILNRLNMMMDTKNAPHFSLELDGTIRWQPDATNPLPGDIVAKAQKGENLYRPEIHVFDSPFLEGKEKDAVKDTIKTWLHHYIETTLKPLFDISKPVEEKVLIEGAEVKEGEPAPTTTKLVEPSAEVRGIGFQMQESMGIIPRQQIRNLIQNLDADGRRDLRRRGVRLAPVLVFMPALNKPASVRLRATLWALWHGLDFPEMFPKDGMVSMAVEADKVNKAYFQAIGYPILANRAIRVDMVDRVISLIYDTAKDGKFQAQHKMAEWFGCSIADLYTILGFLGHTKIEEAKIEETPEPVAEITEAETAETETKATPAKRPELAWFMLKKGRASLGETERPKRVFEKKKPEAIKKKFDKDKKPHKKPDAKKRTPQKEAEPKFKTTANGDRIVASLQATKHAEDSPFAVLQQLKK